MKAKQLAQLAIDVDNVGKELRALHYTTVKVLKAIRQEIKDQVKAEKTAPKPKSAKSVMDDKEVTPVNKKIKLPGIKPTRGPLPSKKVARKKVTSTRGLKQCPKCSEWVGPRSRNCKHCGYTFPVKS